jgi:DNA-binding transcriptional LysR family regulator
MSLVPVRGWRRRLLRFTRIEAEVVEADLARGALVRIVLQDAPPKGYAVPMRAVYLSDRPPGIAGRWFIDQLKRERGT